MFVRPLFSLFLALMMVGSAQAQSAPVSAERAEGLRVRFQSRQRETRTWSANFTQTLVLPGLPKPVISTGTMSYRAPDLLRIDFSKPAGEYVLIVGDRLFLKKAGKSLVEKSVSDDHIGKPFRSLLGMLQGHVVEDEKQFEPTVSKGEGAFTIVLNRRAEAGTRIPKRITNTISSESLDIQRVAVELPNGGTMTYSFEGSTRNKTLANELFALPTER